jgi:hypothetical protein
MKRVRVRGTGTVRASAATSSVPSPAAQPFSPDARTSRVFKLPVWAVGRAGYVLGHILRYCGPTRVDFVAVNGPRGLRS